MYNHVRAGFVGNTKVVRNEVFHNLIDTAAVALMNILIDCSEDFQEVGICKLGLISSRVFVESRMEESSWYF